MITGNRCLRNKSICPFDNCHLRTARNFDLVGAVVFVRHTRLHGLLLRDDWEPAITKRRKRGIGTAARVGRRVPRWTTMPQVRLIHMPRFPTSAEFDR